MQKGWETSGHGQGCQAKEASQKKNTGVHAEYEQYVATDGKCFISRLCCEKERPWRVSMPLWLEAFKLRHRSGYDIKFTSSWYLCDCEVGDGTIARGGASHIDDVNNFISFLHVCEIAL